MAMTPMWSSATDGVLLREARRYPEAFRELYLRHERLVLTYVASKVAEPELAADLTAETFAIALLQHAKFRDQGQSAVAWLLGIARLAILRNVNRRRVELRGLRRLGIEAMAYSDASLERVEALIDAERTGEHLLTLFESLPEAQKEAIRAHVLRDEPYDSLASRLGCTEQTLRQRVSRGLSRLRSAIQEIPS